jgi:hypothetical protein
MKNCFHIKKKSLRVSYVSSVCQQKDEIRELKRDTFIELTR